MTKQRLLLSVVVTAMVAGMVLPARAAAPPKETAPKPGQKAGAITALLPIATVTRGVGKNAVTNQAKKGDELIWNDLVKTLRGGRARITLADQSILSLGSQSELKIIKHDTRSQQTALQLYGGRVRAEVAKITRQGGGFELRTPTAVAGVIGTDFGSDASTVGTTVFLCISGIVQVSNNDPAVQGSVQCAPGLTTSVSAGKPPTIPTNATPEQIQKLIQDTEPAIISAMAPTSALPGATVDATINGTKLGAVNAVSVSGSGITATLAGTPTDTAATVHLVISANATPGPRTITLSKPNQAASAAVFTILQPPTAQTGDFKKPYHDLFSQEGQSNKAGLTALIAEIQQAVDQTLQQLQAANQGNLVDLSPATSNLNQQVAAVQNAINQAGGQVDQAVTSALTTFDTQYTAAYNALLQRNPAAVPDATFNEAVQAAYDQVNASLGLAFANISNNLTTTIKTTSSTVSQVEQTWLTTIAAAAIVPPTPKVNNTERSIDVGAAFGSGVIAAPDAGSSTGNNGATVVRYAWVLCDSAYKPAGFGTPIAANTPGCSPLPGYASSTSDFPFATCNLTPNDYIARVTITDTNNQQAAMDVKIHVLAPFYDDPATRIQNLAAAYSTLQPTQFLSFFDQTAFAGYNSLAENVRNTFPTLASMNINPVPSGPPTINCNDATLGVDWAQNYTYQANPAIAFSQREHLTVRMTRTPGRGWYITDFQGDNGTVQGQLPGPATTDNPLPDMIMNSVYATYAGNSSTTAQLVPPGPQSFSAMISNVGGATLTAGTSVQFALLDASNNVLTSTTVPLTVPLGINATQTVTATLNVPNTLAIGAPFQVGANVNPSCTVPEAHCDASNGSLQALILGTPVHVTQTAIPMLLSGGPAALLSASFDNGGTFALVLPTGIMGCAGTSCTPTLTGSIAQTLTGAGTLSWALQAGFNAAVGDLTTNITYGPFHFPMAYTVTGQANYVVQGVTFVGHTAPYTGAQGLQKGENLIINAVIANVGNVSPAGNITVQATCSGGPAGSTFCNGGTNNPNTTIPAPAAGTSVVAVMTTTIGTSASDLVGAYNGTVALTAAPPQSTTADDSASIPFEFVDFNVAVNQPFVGTQNVLVGGVAQINVVLDETGNPTQFSLPITAGTDNAAVTFGTPTTTVAPGSFLSTPTGSPAAAVPVTVSYSATNHGVTKVATQVLNYVLASITSTTLFLNDPSNPLEVQMGGTSSSSNPIVGLKLNSTPFGGTVNPATVAAPVPNGGFTATVDSLASTTAIEGGTFNLQVGAAIGATPIITTLTTVATLPNSLPAATVTYPLFVKAIGVPDLQIASVTPPRSLSSSTPWLSGEGLDFSIMVKNNGNTASAGGESLTMMLNGYQVDNGTVTVPFLGPGASTTILVHAVAPDIGNVTMNAVATLKTKVAPDAAGDLNYADNSCTGVGACSGGVASGTVNLANWHLGVSGAGSSDASPLTIVITSSGTSWSNQALLGGFVDSAPSPTTLSFNPVAGVLGNSLSISGFSATTSPISFLATVVTSAASFTSAAQSGLYPAQVIVQLLDGATVTAQRQATIHVSISNTFGSALSYPLSVTCVHNGASCIAGAAPAVPIQVNGALTEQYTVTVVPSCTPTPGVQTCQGTADVVITDGANTTTTPSQSKGLPFNTGAVFQLAANQDANGNIATGAASGYAVTINSIQRSSTTSPDAVGQSASVPVNVGDINITANTGANSCTGVVPSGTPLQLTLSWSVLGGFNSPSISWQWEDANHSPVGATPVSFSSPSGTSSFSGGTYTALPTFTLTNTQAQDGLIGYYFSITVSNGTTSATKYFPFYFDLSVNQNFCGAVSGARGSGGTIRGTWSRSAAGVGGPITTAARLATSAGAVDLRLSASDISYTPSVPQYGDTVQVRFRVRNDGTRDAKGVPIALQVNGATVASDTFDVAAGRTVLGGLEWNTAKFAAPAAVTRPVSARPARDGRRGNAPALDTGLPDITASSGRTRLNALLVIDPQHTLQQKTALDKSAPLAHFALRSPNDATVAGGLGNSQRILLEIQDGACAGLRLTAASVGGCGSADLELTVADIAKGTYTLNTSTGIADLGGGAFAAALARNSGFSSELAAQAGHSYAVQLGNGRSALVTIDSIRNPGQLDAATRAVFRNSAVLVLRGMGGDTGAAATGDVAARLGGGGATIFVQLTVQVQ